MSAKGVSTITRSHPVNHQLRLDNLELALERSERCPVRAFRTSSMTTCLRSLGQDCHLRRQGTAQIEAAMALSMIVRLGPARTAVNGTVVAQPARTTFLGAWQHRRQLDRRVRLDPSDACLVGKGRRPAAAIEWDSNAIGTVPARPAPLRIPGPTGRSGGPSATPVRSVRPCPGPSVNIV
jgi:hypothetical protein